MADHEYPVESGDYDDSCDVGFYDSVVQLASQDSILTEAVRWQRDGSRTDGQDEVVEAYIHDDGYLDDLEKRYGLSEDFATEAYRRCVTRVGREAVNG